MPYTKQTWTDNDPATPISAARLSHMEDGIDLIDTHEGNPTDAHDATAISVTAFGNTIATNVQSSLQALETDKARVGNVVNLTADQTIAGTKTFTMPPVVPTPTSSGQAANKTYVDSQVAVGVADESITNAKISPTAAIAQSKIANLTTDLTSKQSTVFKGAANGYAGLDSSILVPTANLGTATPDATKFLRGDRTWAVPPTGGGGGTTSDQTVYAADYGVLGDNVSDSTTELQAAIDSFGSTATARGGKLQLPKGTIVISSTILVERKAVEMYGYGWGPTGSTDGTNIRWAGAAGVPMFQVRQGMGFCAYNLRLMGSKTATPSAGFDLNVDADTQQQPNTFMTFDRVWFGPFSGYDESSLLTSANYLTTGISTSGAEPAEDNLQNDMIRIGGCVFFKCGTAYFTWNTSPGNTQAVGNHILSCFFYYCGTGIDSVAQTMISNVYFAFSSVCDLRPRQDRFSVFNYMSEYAARMAIVEENGELIVNTGYFQIGEKTHADGKVIVAVNNTRNLVDLSYFDFRYLDTAYATTHAGGLPAPKAISIKATGSSYAHKILNLNHVNWGAGGLRLNITAAELDIDPGLSGSSLDDLTITGWIQSPPDAGAPTSPGVPREIFNYLHWKNTTADFLRNDRIVPFRVKAGIPADADYLNAPPNGTQVIDSSNNRLYVRVGGVWKYSALT